MQMLAHTYDLSQAIRVTNALMTPGRLCQFSSVSLVAHLPVVAFSFALQLSSQRTPAQHNSTGQEAAAP
jgi:hypothetical protein